MSAEFLPSARPPHAVIMWSDDNNIYAELPCKSGPPYIQKFSYSDSGLSKALGFLKARQKTYGATRYTIPKDTRQPTAFPTPKGTEESRQKARDILKKMGIT